MKKFNEYLSEALSSNHLPLAQETVVALCVLLSRRFPQLRKRSDAAVLRAIAQAFLFKDVLFVTDTELSDDLRHVTKAYLILGTKYLDTTGAYDKAKIMQKNKLTNASFDNRSFVGTIAQLMELVELEAHQSPLNEKEETELHALVASFHAKFQQTLG